MTNNFLIPKELFLKIQFEESIKGYGHEDTLFGLALKKQNIPILHIHNPLEHLGLENLDSFLEKQREAVKNLFYLHQNYPELSTKLLDIYLKLKNWFLVNPVFWVLHLIQPLVIKQLKSDYPNLFFLDLWKLYHFLKIARQ